MGFTQQFKTERVRDRQLPQETRRSSSPLGPTSHTEVGPGSQKISTETTESEGKCWIDFDLSTFGYTRILPTSLTQIAQIVRHLQNIYKQSLDLG